MNNQTVKTDEEKLDEYLRIVGEEYLAHDLRPLLEYTQEEREKKYINFMKLMWGSPYDSHVKWRAKYEANISGFVKYVWRESLSAYLFNIYAYKFISDGTTFSKWLMSMMYIKRDRNENLTRHLQKITGLITAQFATY